MDRSDKLYIAGHTGLFGAALLREAGRRGYKNIVTRTHRELDLTNQRETQDFFCREQPGLVILAAALVGGIAANQQFMADFCMKNLQITCNVIEAARQFGVKKLLYLGSSCIYPQVCRQPIREDSILTGSCEPTNEGYAIAKIAGVRLCEYYKKQYGAPFISCIPANVYGPNDRFEPERAHVIPSLLMKFHRAKMEGQPSVPVWGSGRAEREFLYIEDAAEGCFELFERYEGSRTVNLGTGYVTSIRELAELVKQAVGYQGTICFDSSKPDGMPTRLLDTELANQYGIHPRTSLEDGVRITYEWYLKNELCNKHN